MADPNLWAPFPDGTSLAQWDDDARTQAGLDALGVSAADQKGYWAYEEVFDDMRKLLRTGARDSVDRRLTHPRRAGGADRSATRG